MEKRPVADITHEGALSLILPKELADRLGWFPWSESVPLKAFTEAERGKLFTSEHAALCFALAMWNGHKVRKGAPQYADLTRCNLDLFAEVMPFGWDGIRMIRWATRRGPELRPDLLTAVSR